ncbi:methyltransferase, partial [Lamprobacter modestohalophilus]|nr:methyltransferase [Lamprobacter modestohalophilus]
LPVNRFQQLFLLGLSQGHKQPSDWAAQTWQLLKSQGQRLIKEGQPIESAEENLAQLTQQAETFAQQQLPMLRALGVV